MAKTVVPTLREGDQVRVYNRLNSGRVIEEGIVTLKKKIIADNPEYNESQLWEVQFEGEPKTYQRWVMPSNKIV